MKNPVILLLFIGTEVRAQNEIIKLKEKIAQSIDQVGSKTVAWRRQIHQNPELGNREVKRPG